MKTIQILEAEISQIYEQGQEFPETDKRYKKVAAKAGKRIDLLKRAIFVLRHNSPGVIEDQLRKLRRELEMAEAEFLKWKGEPEKGRAERFTRFLEIVGKSKLRRSIKLYEFILTD